MLTVFFVIQIIIAIALIGVILIQRNTDDGLGSLGGGGGGNAFLSGRTSANLMTRVTAVLAALFMLNSLFLATMANHNSASKSILDQEPAKKGNTTPAPGKKTLTPSVPVAQ